MLQFLSNELAPEPGRLANVLRITVFTVLVVILAETFQMPFPAYSAYIVFFISKEENTSTLLAGIIVTLAVTVSVFTALAIYTFSIGEPGLRLPLMAFVIFAGMFFSRASPLGTAAFVTGFLVTMALTLIDFIPKNDPLTPTWRLTKSVLWLWPVVMLPVTIVVLGNILSGRRPADLLRAGLAERLELAGRVLQGEHKAKLPGVADLVRYLKLANMFQKKKWAGERLLANVERLLILVSEWMELNVSDRKLTALAAESGAQLLSMAQNIKTNKALSVQKLTLPPYTGTEGKAFLLLATINELLESMARVENSEVPSQKRHMRIFAPDAFSNPDYTQYALKTTLAIFIAYLCYNLLDWPGIRTCMITCFFVALGTFGETAQKMTLRMTGAIIGGALGLGSIVFIMPYLTTITGLTLLVTVITFFAAWVSTSSERLSYAGFQIALAFFLSIFVGYGPTIDLTEARDRVVGILLGNLIVGFVFALIWPESAIARARVSLAAAIENLSKLFSKLGENRDQVDALAFAYDDALAQAKRFASLQIFEPKGLERGTIKVDMRLIDAVDALRGPMIVLGAGPVTAYHQPISAWLLQIADQIRSGSPVFVPLPHTDSLHIDKAYIDWYHTLEERLHQLETVIKQASVPANYTLNQTIRESA